MLSVQLLKPLASRLHPPNICIPPFEQSRLACSAGPSLRRPLLGKVPEHSWQMTDSSPGASTNLPLLFLVPEFWELLLPLCV